MRDGDGSRVGSAAGSAGFISSEGPASQSQAVVQMLLAAGEPLRHVRPYDFGKSDLFGWLFSQRCTPFFGGGFARTPPPDVPFLQRKFVGTFLLRVRLRARVGMARAFSPHL